MSASGPIHYIFFSKGFFFLFYFPPLISFHYLFFLMELGLGIAVRSLCCPWLVNFIHILASCLFCSCNMGISLVLIHSSVSILFFNISSICFVSTKSSFFLLWKISSLYENRGEEWSPMLPSPPFWQLSALSDIFNLYSHPFHLHWVILKTNQRHPLQFH